MSEGSVSNHATWLLIFRCNGQGATQFAAGKRRGFHETLIDSGQGEWPEATARLSPSPRLMDCTNHFNGLRNCVLNRTWHPSDRA